MRLYNNETLQLIRDIDASRILMTEKGRDYSCGDLLKESEHLAQRLAIEGMQPEQRVVLLTEVGVEFLKIMLACMMLKARIAIIDPEMGRKNFKAKLQQFDPNWTFVDSRILLLQEHPILRWLQRKLGSRKICFKKIKNARLIKTGPRMPLLVKGKHIKRIKNADIPTEPKFYNAINVPLLITYTSGTLDEPKGVLHSSMGIATSLKIVAGLIKSNEAQCLATHLPHFFLIGACAGISVKLWDVHWSAKRKLQFIKEESITTLFGPPSEYLDLLSYCQQNGTALPGCLKHLFIGSAPVHRAFLKRLIPLLSENTRVTCLYGMTENLVVAAIDGRLKTEMQIKGDPLGKAISGINLSTEKDGELLVESEQMFLRYWHQSDRPDWHATGDLVQLLPDGMLVMKGRKKDMIIRRSFNIYPGLYEAVIKEIPQVKEAVLIGYYDQKAFDEKVILFLEIEGQIKASAIFKKLKSGPFSIDAEAIPDEIRFTKIPRQGRQQKIDRIRLREIAKSGK